MSASKNSALSASRRRMIAGSLGLTLFLTAAAGHGQAPPTKDKEPSRAVKRLAPAVDAKALGDPVGRTAGPSDRKAAAAAAALLEGAYEGERPPEAVRMLAAVLRGSQMGPGDGWFGPAETRYSWKWLADRCEVDAAQGGIPRDRFKGPEALFSRLDRNKNGVITPDDFDWSDRNPYVQMSYMANRLFRKINAQADGRLTKEDLLQFFEKAAQGKDHLSADDFRDALLAGLFGSPKPGDAPSTPMLIRGLFAGELGSMNEGPKLNERAPDFTLKTADGKQVVQLAKLIGPKPVVLVFGSFT